jgi:hypothetical protein
MLRKNKGKGHSQMGVSLSFASFSKGNTIEWKKQEQRKRNNAGIQNVEK